ncbi:uncharacterized protein LOC134697454 [Mytilus trossulus]|uniref:uncharacterized protein LOC134697454 n=1 Tax=Mytilus trossulus TaxID=6551 RepID=UPI003004C9D0
MDRSLALDKVLTSCYRNIFTKKQFDILKAAVQDVNSGANIEWDASIDDTSTVPYEDINIPEYVVSSNDGFKRTLTRTVKGKVAIDIKDDFLVHSIITIDEHEKVSNDLRERTVSDTFIQLIFDKSNTRAFDCLAHSLQQFNEKQKIKQSNIKSLVDMLLGTSKQSDLSSTRSSIEMIQCSFNQTIEASADLMIKLNLTNDDQQDQSTFNDKVVQNVENITLDLMQVLRSYPTGADKGSVIIYLKSLENDLAKRLQRSLIDGSFVEFLDNLFNDKAIKTSLSKGDYKLEVTIEPYEGSVFQDESECLTENEKRPSPNLISVNRTFLIDQINVIALLEAFGSTSTETFTKFEKAGIYKATEITQQSEIFLDVVEKEGLQETFCNILQEKKMTYVLNRLQTYQKVCSADYTNLRKKIIHNFEKLVNTLDIDDMRETFVERKVFDIPTFDRLEEQFADNREQATAALLIKILKAGHEAVVTLVDVLYINAIDSLANDLLEPLPETTVYKEDSGMELDKSEGLLFEGTFRVLVEKDESDIEKMEVGETCSKQLNYEEIYPKRDISTTKHDDRLLVQQEYKRFLKDTKKKDIELLEDIFDPQIQKERENFYRHSTVVIDLGKEALMLLLKYELSKSGVKFLDFLADNRHNLYHCVYTTCCRCRYNKPKTKKGFSLSVENLETILDNTGLKLETHRHGNFPQLCCSPIKNELTIDQLDYVLLRDLLGSLQLQSNVQQAVDNIETCRNESFFKADVARLDYVQYLELKREIQDAILTVCRYCNTEDEMTKKLKDFMLKPMDMTSLYRRQKKILDAVEEITDKKTRNLVEDKVGVVEFQSSISEEECKQLCGTFFEQKKDELVSFQAELDKSRNLGKRYFHRRTNRGSKQSTQT